MNESDTHIILKVRQISLRERFTMWPVGGKVYRISIDASMRHTARVTRIRDNVEIPQYQTAGAAGFDLAAAVEVTLEPNQIGMIPTGLVIATPPGHVFLLCSRSSAPKKFGISPPHGLGIIDQDYCGPEDEVCVLVRNITDRPVTIAAGTRVAQGLIVPVVQVAFEEGEAATQSRGGFGSTGQ